MIDQHLFDALFITSDELGYSTFDRLPSLKTPYPFVVIGDTSSYITPNKAMLMGRVTASVHFWGEGENRQQISRMMNTLFQQAINYQSIRDYNLYPQLQSCQTQLMEDTSTNRSLWHGILQLEYKFY